MIIYRATNSTNNKCYIGQSKYSISDRKKQHKEDYVNGNTKFYRAIQKYGWDNFTWEVLEHNVDNLDEREKHYICKYNSFSDGYNSTKGGSGRDNILRDMILKTHSNMVFTADYFNEYNINRQSISSYVDSGWIVRLRNGLYKKKFSDVTINDLLYTLHKYSHTDVHIGGRTAISYNGNAHYVRFREKKHLFGTGRLKTYFKYFSGEFNYYNRSIFNNNGINGFVSTDERACLEMIYDTGIDEYSKIMSGMPHLRPKILQELLEACRSIKSKRVLLHFGDKYNLPWFSNINIESIDLGSGKRQIRQGGVLDKRFKIVI